jgi:hypothetical protein
MRISIPLDLSSPPFIPLPCFSRSRRHIPLLISPYPCSLSSTFSLSGTCWVFILEFYRLTAPMYNCREGKTRARAHAHTHTHQPLWRWLVWGFHRRLSIPSSRTRRRGYALSRKATSTFNSTWTATPVPWRTRTTWYSPFLALLVQKYKYWHLKSAETHFTCFTSTKLQILGWHLKNSKYAFWKITSVFYETADAHQEDG